RSHRCMRENETRRRPGRIDQLRHDGREIVAIGAQAMQPQDGRDRIGAGFLDYARQHQRASFETGSAMVESSSGAFCFRANARNRYPATAENSDPIRIPSRLSSAFSEPRRNDRSAMNRLMVKPMPHSIAMPYSNAHVVRFR